MRQSPPRESAQSAMGVVNMTITNAAEAVQGPQEQVEGEIRDFVRRDVATFRRNPESES
jgi:hypothetical protein